LLAATLAKSYSPLLVKRSGVLLQSHLRFQGRTTMGAFCSSDKEAPPSIPQPPPPNKKPKAPVHTLPAKVNIQYCGA
jgi:hypothetical protein